MKTPDKQPIYGIIPDGYWPDGAPRSWRGVEIIERSGRYATIRYQDDGTVTTIAAAAIYSGNAPIDSPQPLAGTAPPFTGWPDLARS